MTCNANAVVYAKEQYEERRADADEYAVEPIDALEIFDHIRGISDPEKSYSLEELRIITPDSIEVDDKQSYVKVVYTPTQMYCGAATQIGLSLILKLMLSLPRRYKVYVRIASGAHADEVAFNKLFNDKERVAAALEDLDRWNLINILIAPSFIQHTRKPS